MLRKSCPLTSGQSHLTEQWLNTDNELQPILRSSGLKQMMSTAKFLTGLLRGIFSNNWIQLLTQQCRGHKTMQLFLGGVSICGLYSTGNGGKRWRRYDYVYFCLNEVYQLHFLSGANT